MAYVEVGDDKTKEKFDNNESGWLSKIEYRKYRESLAPEQTVILKNLTIEALRKYPGLDEKIEAWMNDPNEPGEEQLAQIIRDSDFFKTYDFDSARNAWKIEFGSPPGEWENEMRGARGRVQDEATRLGVQLSEQELDGFARAWIYEGWNKDPNALRDALISGVEVSPWLDQAVSGAMDYTAGLLGDTVSDLRNVAYMNGIDYDDLWFQEAAQSVVGGLSTVDDWKRDIREKAAGYFPAFAKQIEAGMDVRALASPYMQRMNRLWDMPMTSIGLDDPTLLMAMSGQNENGEFKAMNLADFDNMLREDPRWDNSSNGKNTLLNGINSFLKSGGFKY